MLQLILGFVLINDYNLGQNIFVDVAPFLVNLKMTCLSCSNSDGYAPTLHMGFAICYN
jgi:hypothetical protein